MEDRLRLSYHIVQRHHPPQRNDYNRQPGEIFLQVTEDGVRLLELQLADGEKQLCGLDEIRFTKSLNTAEKLDQFRHFIPESLLAETAFSRISLATEPLSFSLVPATLFSPEAAAPLLELAGHHHPENLIFHENINPGMVLIFSIGKEWSDWASGIFDASEITYTSCFSGMLQHAASGMEEEDALLAHIAPRSMHVFGRKNGQLCFFNRYAFRNEQDLLYYFLLAMEQSGLDPESCPVKLCGSILSGSAGFEKISRYAGNLQFALPAEIKSELPPSSGIRHPQYFDLLSLLNLKA